MGSSSKDLIETYLTPRAAAAEVGEEHESSPLLLNLPEEVALRACDEADSFGRHMDHGEVVILLRLFDMHRPDTLSHDAFDVPNSIGNVRCSKSSRQR